jgi:hypothetical protein
METSHLLEDEDRLPLEERSLRPSQRPQWRRDVAALRHQNHDHELFPLKQGDLFNAMQQRGGQNLPRLAHEAGVS